MPRKPNPKPTDPEQSKKFIETAKKLEVDEAGVNFDRALYVIKPVQSTDKKVDKKKK